jgi:hypothetical protein
MVFVSGLLAFSSYRFRFQYPVASGFSGDRYRQLATDLWLGR